MSLNKVILHGRLGADINLTTFESGGCVGNFSLATDESYKDRDGNKVEKTEWHKCVVRNKTAETLEKYVGKGDELLVEGKLATRKYEKNGVDHYTTEVIVMTFSFVGSKSQGATNENQPTPQGQGTGVKDDDDLPF